MNQVSVCPCGVEFVVLPHYIELETKLCDDCVKREVKIMLFQRELKRMKHERPYSFKSLMPYAHKEYDATKKRVLS